MTTNALMKLGRLIGVNHILVAAKHNKRTMYAAGFTGSDIDAARSHLNYSLAGPGTPDGVVTLWRKQRASAGIKKPRRTDEVSAIEIIFSLPVDTQIDLSSYFTACTTWVANRFGGSNNILSSDVHLDESAPHCHVIVVPLVDGKMKGSDLYWGGSKNHEAQHDDFYACVGSHYGLRKPQAKKKPSKSVKEAQATQVRNSLRALPGDAERWAAVAGSVDGSIGRDSGPYLKELGLTPTAGPKKTLKEIALSTGAGPKTEAGQARKDASFHLSPNQAGRKPIGFGDRPQASDAPSNDQTLSCVGFDHSIPFSVSPAHHPRPGGADSRQTPSPAPEVHPPHSAEPTDQPAASEYTRTRDADLDPADFDPDRGEHITRQVRTQSAKAAAMAWVSGGLPTRPDAAAPQAAR